MKVELTTRDSPNGTNYWSLTAGRIYEVLGIEGDWYRLLDDRQEPVLFDPVCFRLVEADEPSNWVSEFDDGVRYAYPVEWGRPGFFEDWHDRVPIVLEQFDRQLLHWHPAVTR
jgi:hypothetical protein